MIRRLDGGSPAVERFTRPQPPEPKPVARPEVAPLRDTFRPAPTTARPQTSTNVAAPDPKPIPGGLGGLAGLGLNKRDPVREQLEASAGYRELSPEQQKQTLDVYQATDAEGRQALLELTNRQVDGHTALLDEDSQGNSTLDSLHRMATQPLPDSFQQEGLKRADLLASVCQEASDPGTINQSNRGTCTVTSMQYLMCSDNPAEYVRLMAGLTSESGRVALANGDTITRDGDSVAMDSATDRTSSERLFQAAMMQYARGGAEGDYSNIGDQPTGLTDKQINRAYEGLFDQDVETYDGSFWNFTPGEKDVLNLLKERSPQDTFITMDWGEGKSSGHAVVVDRVENGRVYIRNPHGPGGTQGEQLQDPPRIVEDPENGIQSMSEEDFLKWVRNATVPN